MTDEIKVLFPDTEVVLNGVTYTMRPFKAGQLAEVAGLMKKIVDPILEAYNSGNSANATAILNVIAVGGPDLLRLLALSIKMPVVFVEELEVTDLFVLLSKFIEVNSGFFTQSVLPAILKIKSQISAGLTS